MSYAGTASMRAYSTDLKERLVRAVADGQPMREAARRFGVAVDHPQTREGPQHVNPDLPRNPHPASPPPPCEDHEAVLQNPVVEGAPLTDVEPHSPPPGT